MTQNLRTWLLGTPAKVELGKALFFDPRLSKSGFIACASCHNLASGGVDRLATSIGHQWHIGVGTRLSLADAASIAIFLRSLEADPLLAVTLPRLPPSTATTPRPQVN